MPQQALLALPRQQSLTVPSLRYTTVFTLSTVLVFVPWHSQHVTMIDQSTLTEILCTPLTLPEIRPQTPVSNLGVSKTGTTSCTWIDGADVLFTSLQIWYMPCR